MTGHDQDVIPATPRLGRYSDAAGAAMQPLEPVILPSLGIAAATTSGDLGRTGELALGILSGRLLAGATASLLDTARSDRPEDDTDTERASARRELRSRSSVMR